jgi:hypothetical protein
MPPMRTLFSNDDLKRLASGVSIACAAGLLLGATMQPNLDEHDAEGPQMLMGESGARKVFAAFDPGVGRYQGQIPEHVVGTDWTRPRSIPVMAYDLGPEDTGETVVYEDASPVEVASSAYADEPRPEPVYPSMRGNTHYETDLPPAPPPPADLDAEVVISG